MENSFSPMSLASPPVAAMFPAVSEASEVVSRFSVAPTEAISWPFLSTRKTIFAFASRERRSQTALICWNSSSYITICGCIARPLPLLSAAGNANRRRGFGLQLAPALQCAGQRHLIGVLEVAAHGQALCNSRHAHAERLDQPREVESGRFALYRGIGGDDHFRDSNAPSLGRPRVGGAAALRLQPHQQFLDFQLIGPHAIEGAEGAVEHVIAAAELASALHREQVGHARNHADDARVALRVAADRAGILRGEVAADRAEPHLLLQREERLGEVARVLGRALEDVEREPLRRL